MPCNFGAGGEEWAHLYHSFQSRQSPGFKKHQSTILEIFFKNTDFLLVGFLLRGIIRFLCFQILHLAQKASPITSFDRRHWSIWRSDDDDERPDWLLLLLPFRKRLWFFLLQNFPIVFMTSTVALNINIFLIWISSSSFFCSPFFSKVLLFQGLEGQPHCILLPFSPILKKVVWLCVIQQQQQQQQLILP